MLGIVFKRRVMFLGLALLLLLVPNVWAQDDTDYCETADSIEYGDNVDGTIDDDLPYATFCFEGNEDDEVTIVVETSDGDLVSSVFLSDPFLADVFAEDTARNENGSAEISFTLPDDGDYLIVVSREDLDEGNSEGDFEMSLDADEARSSSNNSSNNNNNNNNSDITNFCDEEPLATLSQYQYGIPGNDPEEPLLAYNVGCTGFLVSTVVGRSLVVEYEVSRRGEMSFATGDTTYTTVEANDEEWVIDVSNGEELHLERLQDDGCDEDELGDLVRGAWLGSNDVVFDFTCNGVLLLTLDGETTSTLYDFGRNDITITLEDGDVVLENYEIDGSSFNAELNGDTLELENLLD